MTSAPPAKVPAVPSENGLRPTHFFVLASLMAATGAVIVSRQSTPEHLVLISVTIGAAGLATAGFYRMLAPLVTDPAESVNEPLSERARAVIDREKALTLRSLKDLEFDRSMGKMSQADFDEMTTRLRARALSLMKQLDEDGTGYRSMIERELNARLASRLNERQAMPGADSHVPVDVEKVDKAVCSCGTHNDPDALFCKRCGTKLLDATQTSR
jgi:ribosomal protein L40E